MKTQKDIAKAVKTSQQFISLILKGKRRPSYPMAKKLAQATGTDPILWLEGSPDDIKLAVFIDDDKQAA